jgi:hypothetical protein
LAVLYNTVSTVSTVSTVLIALDVFAGVCPRYPEIANAAPSVSKQVSVSQPAQLPVCCDNSLNDADADAQRLSSLIDTPSSASLVSERQQFVSGYRVMGDLTSCPWPPWLWTVLSWVISARDRVAELPPYLSCEAGYQPLALITGMAASDVRNAMRLLPASGSLAAALRPAVRSI